MSTTISSAPSATSTTAFDKPAYQHYVLAMLVLGYVFNVIDRSSVLGAVLPSIKEEIQASNFQMGLLGGLAFAVFYSFMGIPIARLADRWSRVNVLALAVALWSASGAVRTLMEALNIAYGEEEKRGFIRFYGTAQQTIMGSYIEQNVKAFLSIQKKLQDQAKQIYGDKMMITPDLWKQFMQMQAPALQGMLGNYLEQSAKLFMDMQQRMQDQTRGILSTFSFPNFGIPPSSDDDRKS